MPYHACSFPIQVLPVLSSSLVLRNSQLPPFRVEHITLPLLLILHLEPTVRGFCVLALQNLFSRSLLSNHSHSFEISITFPEFQHLLLLPPLDDWRVFRSPLRRISRFSGSGIYSSRAFNRYLGHPNRSSGSGDIRVLAFGWSLGLIGRYLGI